LLNTDGGMVNDGRRKRGDPPGDAAVAVVLSKIKNNKEVLIEGFSGAIGPATNDVAEYTALVEGLRFALSEGVQRIRIYVDSEFLVDQVNHRTEVKQEDLRPLHNEAHDLLHRFLDHRVSWIPRQRNANADALVRSILYD
jgi:ribonuclease HI